VYAALQLAELLDEIERMPLVLATPVGRTASSCSIAGGSWSREHTASSSQAAGFTHACTAPPGLDVQTHISAIRNSGQRFDSAHQLQSFDNSPLCI